jgi:ribonuclease P protein component
VTSLRGRADFRRVLEHGGRYGDRLLALRALQGPQDVLRIGISVGKSLGKAVQRNRVRRWLRESARAAVRESQGAWDLVLIPRGAARTATHEQLRESVFRLLRRAGVSSDGG